MNMSSGLTDKTYHNSSNALSNATKTVDNYNALNTVTSWFTVFTILATLFTNGLIVVVYCMHNQLRTPFNVYIVNIALTENLLALTAMPGTFILSWYDYWPFSSILCTLFIYCKQILGVSVRYGHVLVALNRLWAVTFPVHYRMYQSTRFAVGAVVATWVYVHALNLPLICLTLLDKKAYQDNGCHYFDAAGIPGLTIAVEMISFDLPEIIIVLAYLWIRYRLGRIRQKTTAKIAMVPVGCSNNKSLDNPILQPVNSVSVQRTTLKIDQNFVSGPEAVRRTSRSHDRVLAYLVLGVIICWTPNHVFFLLADTTGYWNSTFAAVQFFIQYTYSWINPILCFMAMRPLRMAVNDALHCRNSDTL